MVKDIQIEQLRMGVAYRGEIICRGFHMYVRPLSIFETVQVAARVAETMRGLPDIQKNTLTEHALIARETLILASTEDYGTNNPKISGLILDQMTPDELNYLFKQYVASMDKANPMLEEMDATEVKLLVEQVKKNPSALTELSFFQILNVCRALMNDG